MFLACRTCSSYVSHPQAGRLSGVRKTFPVLEGRFGRVTGVGPQDPVGRLVGVLDLGVAPRDIALERWRSHESESDAGRERYQC